MKKTMLILWSLLVVSCTSHVEELESVKSNLTASINVPDTTSNVTIQTVSNIAITFSEFGDIPSRTTKREIKDIESVNSESGEPLFYIVNYTNNQGFLVISATKDYYPILAFSEKGEFRINNAIKSGAKFWYEGHKNAIANSDSIPNEMKKQFRALWTNYNIQEEPLVASRNASEVYSLINRSISQWQSEGYLVYTLSDYKNTGEFQALPQNIQNSILQNAEIYTNLNYGNKHDISFILKKDVYNYKVGPLLQTTWGQENGYNAYVPYLYPVGCTAVSMGQIMRYHECPSSYNWDLMSNNSASTTTASLLYDIGEAVNTTYTPAGSGATTEAAFAAFKNIFGYSNIEMINHDAAQVENQLKLGYPVWMRGVDNNQGGHAWVCDGYQIIRPYAFIKLMTLEDCPSSYTPQTFTNPYTYPMESDLQTAYHMNWGWGDETPNYDGYFADPLVNPGNGNANFSSYRIDFINIYPTN